jgi:hypothetical protein
MVECMIAGVCIMEIAGIAPLWLNAKSKPRKDMDNTLQNLNDFTAWNPWDGREERSPGYLNL